MIKNSVSNGLLVEFETIFPDEGLPDIDDLLEDIPKRDVLLSVIQFLSIKRGNSRFDDPRELVNSMFSVENHSLANFVNRKLTAFIEGGISPSIIHSYSSLKIFERVFQTVDTEESLQSNQDFEQNLFKAYLGVGEK